MEPNKSIDIVHPNITIRDLSRKTDIKNITLRGLEKNKKGQRKGFTNQDKENEPPDQEQSNGNLPPTAPLNQEREPSYVSLARCLSGYSTLSYDPSRQVVTRSPSPITCNTPRNQNGSIDNNNFLPQSGKYILPLGGRNINLQQLNLDMPTENKGVNGGGVASVSPSKTISSSSCSLSRESSSLMYTSSKTCHQLSSSTNGNHSGMASSFIVQRVERLYGPGALAQAFYSRLYPPRRLSSADVLDNKTPVREKQEDLSSKSVPVMRLLRPEFRAQLTLAPKKLSFTSPSRKAAGGKDEVDTCAIVEKQAPVVAPAAAQVKDGHYFLEVLAKQVAEIERLAGEAERELETCDNEEGCGVLRAAAYKARLLVAEKLNQFQGLCHKNIKESSREDFPTTNDDLAGFWDMVMLQVKEILGQFERIKVLRENDWQEKEEKKVVSRGGASKKGGQGKQQVQQVSEARKARDAARRKMLQERRQAMKEQAHGAPGADQPIVIL